MTARIRRLFSVSAVCCALLISLAGAAHSTVMEDDGWVVLLAKHSYQDLITRVDQAAKANKIAVVTRASATVGAKKVLDQTIRGNMVVGLFHPRFAVRMLDASISAGIEAPIRMYLTENEDGTATLSYKTPSHVFAPYLDEGGAELKALAEELDELFEKVAEEAAGQ